ncbi:MAG: ANTAR domain-containing protein [Nocardioidaceae bacterium]
MSTDNAGRIARAGDGEPGTVFRSLATLVYSCDDYFEMYQAICDAALHLVDGCDHASLMLEQHGRLVTAAATDEVARHIDELERRIGEGPCVDAIHEEAAQLDADLADRSAWPKLRDRVLEETPVRGMAGFRLVVDDRKLGALNLFSDRPTGLTMSSVDQAAVLVAFASVALIAAARDEQAKTLRDGLDSNREIGKAVGLMMAFHKVDDDQAFDILRKASQDMNVKISEIAKQVVSHHNQRPPG